LPNGTSPVSNGILFAANNFNCSDCLETGIYFVTFDGANITKVPNVAGLYPAWEPKYERFAYVQDGEVFIANADGTGSTQLTHAHASISSLDFDTDGSQILATCQPYGEFDICLIDAKTGAVRNITPTLSGTAGIPYPSFFGEDRILVGRVIIDSLGIQIASAPASGRISPDGTRFAGIMNRQIVNVAPDGTDQRRITRDSPAKGFPIWSPDGTWIFYSVAPGDGRIYLYGARADGSSAPFQLVTRPIAAGPGPNSPVDVYLGYSFTP
jgi:Tol biopolymer transport system component